MIEGLIAVLITVAIVALVGWVVVMLLQKAGAPLIAANIVWAIVALIGLLVLLRFVLGGDLDLSLPD